MARKSALQKIESHEKLCRIMQKQTFEQIKEMQERIKRVEYWIVGGMGAVLLISPAPGVLSMPRRVAVIDLVISFKLKCFESCII